MAFLLSGNFLSLKGLLSFQGPCHLHVTLDGSRLKLNLNNRLGRIIIFVQPCKYNRISLRLYGKADVWTAVPARPHHCRFTFTYSYQWAQDLF